MRIAIGNREFAPRPVGIAFVVVLLAVCVSLGYWQIGRGRAKQELLDAFTRGAITSIDMTGLEAEELARYQHVRVRGRDLPDRQVLLDSLPSASGVAGYRVLTPLERADGQGLLLVDRGWVPMGATRERLPDVSVSGEVRLVRGRLDTLPVPGLRLGEAGAAGDARWPRVLLFPTAADLEAALGTPVPPRILLLDADLPEGYERRWRPSIGFGPERHLGYAIQWFALAVAAAIAFVAMSLRRSGRVGDDPP
jgi:surfeit locus 1 family protein